jgi:hypothetical protein
MCSKMALAEWQKRPAAQCKDSQRCRRTASRLLLSLLPLLPTVLADAS